MDDQEQQQLTISNDIEDLSDQRKSLITITKKTFKRKRDDHQDKTQTRSWSIVLGPSPTFGQTTNEHIKWLNLKKRKSDIQRE